VLADSYVRFFALCAELARERQNGAVVALVTNASFLDGLVHRGMRARLASWFDEVQVLDLGGSALVGRSRERRDDNVFGVRPSVAVTWLCRYPRTARSTLSPGTAHCSYARQFGSRNDKLAWLSAVAPEQLAFQPLACLYSALPIDPSIRASSAP
jgi:predicted helicase